jgi:hypothetical protein
MRNMIYSKSTILIIFFSNIININKLIYLFYIDLSRVRVFATTGYTSNLNEIVS